MPRIPVTPSVVSNPARDKTRATTGASRTGLRDAATPVAPLQATTHAAPETSAAPDARDRIHTSPGFAALRPAVDQEFEEPMFN